MSHNFSDLNLSTFIQADDELNNFLGKFGHNRKHHIIRQGHPIHGEIHDPEIGHAPKLN